MASYTYKGYELEDVKWGGEIVARTGNEYGGINYHDVICSSETLTSEQFYTVYDEDYNEIKPCRAETAVEAFLNFVRFLKKQKEDKIVVAETEYLKLYKNNIVESKDDTVITLPYTSFSTSFGRSKFARHETDNVVVDYYKTTDPQKALKAFEEDLLSDDEKIRVALNHYNIRYDNKLFRAAARELKQNPEALTALLDWALAICQHPNFDVLECRQRVADALETNTVFLYKNCPDIYAFLALFSDK